MRIYIINDYEEHGPLNIRVALTPDAAREAVHARLDEDWPDDRAVAGYAIGVLDHLEILLSKNEPCSTDLGIGFGWGGLQLHIVDTVD